MNAKLPMLLVFLAAAGCAAKSPVVQASHGSVAASTAPDVGAAPEQDAPRTPADTLAQADLAYESQLGASRGQFDRDRQVAVLREAMLLYTQFLERAEGQPELLPAVRKSRERIADVKATIEFLEQQDKPGAEPPHATTQ